MPVQIRCLCGRTKEIVDLGLEALPVDAKLCHCNTCRTTSGMLACSYLDLSFEPPFLQGLSAYRISEEETRYFCAACGTHMVQYLKSHGQYRLASGIVEHSGNVIKVVGHEKVEETGDGGLHCFLRLDEIFRNKQNPAETSDNKLAADIHQISHADVRLQGQCHCGGVEYSIGHPNEESDKLSSPWADLLIPYHSASPEEIKNAGDVKWWLRSNDTKYLAGLCSCRSCRLASGFPIQSWTFVPKSNIRKADGMGLDFHMGTLRQLESSPSVYREFCGRCGATVFWHCEERPELIDVSVGLLHAASGTLAVDWLDWHKERVSFAEEAQDKELVDALEHGLQLWTEPKC